MTAWTDEQIAEVKRFWIIGWTATAIGARLGKSRNAVIGIIHRKGLNGRQPPPRVTKPRVKRQAPSALVIRSATSPKPETLPKPIGAPPQPRGDKPRLIQLRSGDCRWPYGNPLHPDFHFCGAPQALGSSYCAAHKRLGVTAKSEVSS